MFAAIRAIDLAVAASDRLPPAWSSGGAAGSDALGRLVAGALVASRGDAASETDSARLLRSLLKSTDSTSSASAVVSRMARCQLAELLLSSVVPELRDAAQAESLLREVLAASPRDAHALMLLPQAMRQRGASRAAVRDAFEAAERICGPLPSVMLPFAKFAASRDASEAEVILRRCVTSTTAADPSSAASPKSSAAGDALERSMLHGSAVGCTGSHDGGGLAEVLGYLAMLVHQRATSDVAARGDDGARDGPRPRRLSSLATGESAAADEAEALYRRVVALSPLSASALVNFGLFQSEVRGNTREAEALYRRALFIAPDHAHGCYNLGSLLDVKLGRFDEAQSLYERAIAILPTHTQALLNLAVLLEERRGDLDRAETHYRLAVTSSPHDASVRADYAVFLWTRRGDVQAAHEQMRRASDDEPLNTAVLTKWLELLESDEAARLPAADRTEWRALADDVRVRLQHLR